MAAKSRNEDGYGIGAVARLTGLTDHTIRVWERRYSAVVTERSQNGRRVYTPGDVEKLGLLKRLTDQGVSIGKIAGDSVADLRERLSSLNEIVSDVAPDQISVAVLGDFLPTLLGDADSGLGRVNLLVADHNRESFEADLTCQNIDVVVVECPVIDKQVCEQLSEYLELSGAMHGVIVYRFGRARDISAARDAGMVVVRSPLDAEEICTAISGAYNRTTGFRPRARQNPVTPVADWDFAGPIAPRLFSRQQLKTLANAATAIDCECPHHLAQLVADLTAFEVYSANCANRDADDAALHRYLHRTTAAARAQIEAALERVAAAEGIDY